MSAPLKGSNNRYTVLVVLALVLVCSQIWSSNQRKWKRMQAANPALAAPAAAPAAGAAQRDAATSQSLAALRAAPWGEDPFWKSAAAAFRPVRTGIPRATRADAPAFVLRGILSGGSAPSAQINRDIVQAGGIVEGWTVTTIGTNSVTLTRKGAHVTLHLHEGQP